MENLIQNIPVVAALVLPVVLALMWLKFATESEQEVLARFYKWKRQGMCLFRDDSNREFILDLIDAYIDAKEALYDANN